MDRINVQFFPVQAIINITVILHVHSLQWNKCYTYCPLEVWTNKVISVDVAGQIQFKANIAYLNSSSHTTWSAEEEEEEEQENNFCLFELSACILKTKTGLWVHLLFYKFYGKITERCGKQRYHNVVLYLPYLCVLDGN